MEMTCDAFGNLPKEWQIYLLDALKRTPHPVTKGVPTLPLLESGADLEQVTMTNLRKWAAQVGDKPTTYYVPELEAYVTKLFP